MTSNSSSPATTAAGAEPGAFRARRLTASLTVADLERSAAWYRDVVGFIIEKRHERAGKLVAASLRAGDVEILLGQDDGATGEDRVKGQGFSLQFTTDQSIDEIAARIRQGGGTIDTEPTDMPWGVRVFRFRDPDGFKLVMSSPPTA